VGIEYDEIGIWSEVKLAIIKEYASAYARIMDAQRRERIRNLRWIYIDAYAGPGYHLSKASGELVEGSPLIALNTKPPFHEYHFVDTDSARAEHLRNLAGERADVFTYSEDCNKVLLWEVFPRAKYEDYRRALCLLDPYNINLTWQVIEAAGKASSIEIFMNLMIMDINRNAMRRNPDRSIQSKMDQLTRLWGDESWKKAGYATNRNLFDEPEKVSNEEFAEAFRRRLEEKGGFKYVPAPMPMKTKSNSTIYYLYFASQKPAAANIVVDIFAKYRRKQGL
jgi:three-Cys-motif partner protein